MKRSRCSIPSPALLAAVLGFLTLAAPAALAGKKPKESPQALLLGNVFQENGFSLRGARVVVINLERPKEKKETTTDVQGEFAVRVPAVKARYAIEVSAEGFSPDKKNVEITGEEQINLTFHLAPLATGARR